MTMVATTIIPQITTCRALSWVVLVVAREAMDPLGMDIEVVVDQTLSNILLVVAELVAELVAEEVAATKEMLADIVQQ